MNCCFIITSCVFPSIKELSYSKIRSIFTPEERLLQTKKTVESIKKYCPNAHIILIDNGIKNPIKLKDEVDEFYYISNLKIIQKISSTKNKSLGEWIIMMYAFYKCEMNYDYIFKISGRYCLNENFHLSNYSAMYFNFKYIANEQSIEGIHAPLKGIHTTRLYAIPNIRIKEYKKTLILALPRIILKKMSMEASITRGIKSPINYIKTLGVKGNVAVDDSYHEE